MGSTLPHEQEVATVMASLADVGVLRRLPGGDHYRAGRVGEQLGAPRRSPRLAGLLATENRRVTVRVSGLSSSH